jgi:hypothetical protein
MKDELLTIAKSAAITANAAQIGDILDFGAAYNTGGFDAVITGKTESAITGTGLTIQGSVNEAFTTPVNIINYTYTTADKAAGANFIIGELPKTQNYRYLRALSIAASGGTGVITIEAKMVVVQKASCAGVNS